MRATALVVSFVASLACDTMIADRLIITIPQDSAAQRSSVQDGLTAVRDTLAACGFQRESSPSGDLWVWNDPDHPPALHATVTVSANRVTVHLVQGLYGAIGPTQQYELVKNSLVRTATQRYGKASVEVE